MNQLDVECMEACTVGTALDGMRLGLVMTNADGRVLWLNRIAEDLLQARKPDCYGAPLSELLRDRRLAEFWAEALTIDGTVLGEVPVHVPEPANLKVNATPCRNTAGECIGRVLLFHDVTSVRDSPVRFTGEATEGLTPQELRILRLVGEGEGNQQIAAALEIATSTVRSHLKHVYRKTGISSRAGAVSFAIRHGLS
ncbi:MAG: helix-turn-helix transcriptional regulator [Planctomycetota bacterium]|jgi:DNA-binding CsgD family transcriptional regulator